MMKVEFERLIGEEVSQEVYDKVEIVYTNYPGINDKQQIADLYKQFGMVIIADLFPRANEIQSREDKIHKLQIEIADLKKADI